MLKPYFFAFSFFMWTFFLSASLFAEENKAESAKKCTSIEHKLQRLTCFDTLFSTPIYGMKHNIDKPVQWLRATDSESKRGLGDEPLLSLSDNNADIWVTIPAINVSGVRTPPLLVLSCVGGISRVELILHNSLNKGRVKVSLGSLKEQGWRSDDSGLVLASGRGNVALQYIKYIQSIEQLTIYSDSELINGLEFSVLNLKTVLNPIRERCSW